MTKRRKRKGKVHPLKPAKDNTLLKNILRFWKILSAIISVIAVLIGFIALSPSVKVYTDNIATKLDKTINSRFIIENSSYFKIDDLRFEYLFRNVESKGLSWDNTANRVITTADIPTTTLKRNESTTAVCKSGISFVGPITKADVEIHLFYRYLFWNRKEQFRFVTDQNVDGSFMWTPKAMADQ